VPSPGLVIVVSGPSGVGKGTVIRHLRELRPDLRRSVSCTTRPPRDGEVEGQDYHFISPEEFERRHGRGEFLEWAVVHRDQSYGTLRAEVMSAVEAGQDIVLEIDFQGAMSVKERVPEAVLVFLAPPSWEELKRRLKGRRTESAERIAARVETAYKEIGSVRARDAGEMATMPRYDYLLVNESSEETARLLSGIIEAEKRRLTRVNWENLQQRLLAEAKQAWSQAPSPLSPLPGGEGEGSAG
jgi:guanylate kinase